MLRTSGEVAGKYESSVLTGFEAATVLDPQAAVAQVVQIKTSQCKPTRRIQGAY